MISDVYLDFSNNGRILCKDGKFKELSLAEAKIFQDNSKSELTDQLVYRGIDFDFESTEISEQSRYIRSNLPEASTLCMVDTQTAFNAKKCLEGKVSPLNLIDLATFTAAAVFFGN